MRDSSDNKFENNANSVQIHNANPFDVIEQQRLLEFFTYAASSQSPFDNQAREQARFTCQLLQRDIDHLREHGAWGAEVLIDKLGDKAEEYFHKKRHKNLKPNRVERALRRMREREATH